MSPEEVSALVSAGAALPYVVRGILAQRPQQPSRPITFGVARDETRRLADEAWETAAADLRARYLAGSLDLIDFLREMEDPRAHVRRVAARATERLELRRKLREVDARHGASWGSKDALKALAEERLRIKEQLCLQALAEEERLRLQAPPAAPGRAVVGGTPGARWDA